MSAFVRKLRHGARLTESDESVLVELSSRTRRVGRGDIVPEGTEPLSIMLIVEGWVCRYKLLENGKRQITSIFLPGDLCEPFGALPRSMDHTLAALTPAVLAFISPNDVRATAQVSSRVEEALWWDLLFSEALNREQIVCLGRRSATERLAHFFCSLHLRLSLVGLEEHFSYNMPLTQIEISDLFGLSVVHVNRSLQELRGSGLLSLRDHRLIIHDLPGLRELSMFDPSYLPMHGAILEPTWPRPPRGPNRSGC